jgi:hypothetical protein
MRTTGLMILSPILLLALVYAGYGEGRSGGNSLDQGGTYCNAAAAIPGNSTDFIDTGNLDGDNDCSTPFAWPYNEVFYRFSPTATGSYIFRLQVSAPSTDVALRITANACCNGAIQVASVNAAVPADCDTGITTYLRADLSSGTTYWIHAGDNSPSSHFSPYRFEMMLVPCPRTDSDIAHQTCETAMELALTDSIMGDSAYAGHADWYVFTVDGNTHVTISEFGRSFGHCNSGFFPSCFVNPLNAHFFVYCSCTDLVPLAEGHNQLCSSDAQVSLCLPPATYWIKVENYGGESWLGWKYILAINSTPSDTVCPNPCAGCLALRYELPTINCLPSIGISPLNFFLPLRVVNPCVGTCESVVVGLSNGSGPGGTGTVTPPNQVSLGAITGHDSVTTNFGVHIVPTSSGGCITFSAFVTSSCGNISVDTICVYVPPCSPDFIPCPGPGMDTLVINPDHAIPGFQTATACGLFHTNSMIIVVDSLFLSQYNLPVTEISSGCVNCGNSDCVGLLHTPIYSDTSWRYDSMRGKWYNTIQRLPTDSGCCFCIHLNFILPVELMSFTATAGDAAVTLNWITASEKSNDHFDIRRDGLPVTSIPGAGNSTVQNTYTWTDIGLNNRQQYSYTLIAVDPNGARQELGTVTARPNGTPSVITEYALYQNHPNPFNPLTQIVFDLPEKGVTSLKVYNLMGQEVTTLLNGPLTSGRHVATFDASSLPSGIYIYSLRANDFRAEKKMLLVK